MLEAGFVRLSELVELPLNAKLHDIGGLHVAINEFGFVDRVVINTTTDHLVAGHGRRTTLMQQFDENADAPPDNVLRVYDAGKEGEATTIIDWDVPCDRTACPPEKEDALALALNKIGEGEWDERKLAVVLTAINAHSPALLRATGFDTDDLSSFLFLMSAPSLDKVKAQHPEPDERSFWATFAIKLPPVLYKRLNDTLAKMGKGEDHERLEKLLDRIDPQ